MNSRDRASAEAGMTLVEVLVTLMIMGLAIAGITSGLGTASLASATHRRTVTADQVARNYAEAIKQYVRAGGYQTCAPSGAYSAATVGYTAPTGFTVTQTQPTYQQLGTSLNVVLVLDTSYSITQAGAVPTVISAANAFLNGLAGTGARAALVTFGTTATVQNAATTDLASLSAKITPSLFSGVQFTNWEDGLTKAAAQFSTFPSGSKPLVVMVTDGDPTTSNGLPLSDPLARAVTQANAVKTAGSKIFGVGVGSLNETNLQAISGKTPGVSGTVQFPANAFNNSDWTKANTFGDLQASLGSVAAALAIDTFVTGTCPNPDQGAQSLSLTASSVDGRDTETLNMIVRRP